VELLTPGEREAYERFLRSDKAPLGPELSSRLFESFLNGKTCSDIQHDNCELSYGSIVDARVRDNWDEQRATFMQKLLEKAGNRALRAQLEAVEFVFEMFQVTHLFNRAKFEAFKKSLDPKDLQDALRVESVKQYKDLIMALALLAGKASGDEGGGAGMSLPHPASPTVSQPTLAPGERPVPALESADYLTQAAARRRAEQAQQQDEIRAVEAKKAASRPPPKKREGDGE
jgi:hypothetical protein